METREKQGWDFDPDQVEALLKKNADILKKWREALKHQGERTDLPDFHDNIMEVNAKQGTSKSYTLSRLAKETPGSIRTTAINFIQHLPNQITGAITAIVTAELKIPTTVITLNLKGKPITGIFQNHIGIIEPMAPLR